MAHFVSLPEQFYFKLSSNFLLSVCFLLKYLNRQTVWIVYEVVLAITLACVPHSPNLGSLYACAIGIGVGSGVLNTIINVWIIEMWREKSPSVLQIPGLTFGVGTILAPLIIKPFLVEGKHKISDAIKNTTTTVNSLVTTTMTSIMTSTNATIDTLPCEITNNSGDYDRNFEEYRRSLLKTPFYILGAIQLLCE